MNRFFPAALAAALALPGIASAATVSFDVEAQARITLTSATFADSGADAIGSLTLTHAIDLVDEFPEASGNATAAAVFTPNETDGSVRSRVTGTAGGPFGSSSADAEGRFTSIFENTSDTLAIDLVFDFAALLSQISTGAGVSTAASAFVEIQDGSGPIFRREVSLFDPDLSFTGEVSLSLGAGETIYAISYADAFGDAFVFDPAPIPVPAALPLLLAGLGGLAFLRRHRG